MANIHATALIDPAAGLGREIEIGPYCVIGPHVRLANDVRLRSHVVIEGQTTLGPGCEVFPFACLGHIPQDKKYQGEASRLEIGAHTTIREYVTMNPGTEGGGLVTRVGSHGLFMAGAHVAHDCQVGDHVIFANNATLAGHVTVGEHAILGGLSAVHQFVRIGAHAFIGGMSGVENDVIPFGMALGNRAALAGLNIIGLRRSGLERERIHILRKAYQMLFSQEEALTDRLARVEETFGEDPGVRMILAFIREQSDRSLCVPKAVPKAV